MKPLLTCLFLIINLGIYSQTCKITGDTLYEGQAQKLSFGGNYIVTTQAFVLHSDEFQTYMSEKALEWFKEKQNEYYKIRVKNEVEALKDQKAMLRREVKKRKKKLFRVK